MHSLGECRVTIERPLPLTAWIDTSIYNNIAKLHADRLPDAATRDRAARLEKALRAAVTDDRLLVVEGQEAREVLGERLRDFQRVMLPITQDRRFRPSSSVVSEEVYALMRAYHRRLRSTRISLGRIFDLPFEPVPDIFIRASLPGGETVRRDLVETGVTIADRVEEIRLERRRAFSEAATEEYAAWLRCLRDGLMVDSFVLQDIFEGSRRGRHPHRDVLFQERGDLDAFLTSAQARAIPSAVVSSNLWADILCGGDDENVKRSDGYDVRHLTAVLPYVDIVLTDKHMASRIRRRKLDRVFSVDVYSIKEVDRLVSRLAGT